jgi:outer membrane protein TolC
VVVALLFAGSGCLGPQPEALTYSPPPSPARTVPPSATDVRRAGRLVDGGAKPVILVSYAEPDLSVSKFAEAQPQPLPQPRPAGPEPKPGSEPPPPPKDLPPVTGSPASVGGPLGVDEVLAAVDQHYPLLRAVEMERAIAGGRLVSSMGAFDTNLTASADGQGTTYDNFRSGVGVSQGLPFGGLGVFAGYRNGYGDFPTYNLGQRTADGGEFRAGVSIPLLQNRAIDRPRANVRQARLDVAIAEPVIERQRLDFQRAAARTYWNWVAAGHRLKVAESLVKLAVERDEQLRARVEVGPAANIERIDNQQNIALRNGVLVQAQRAFQQATIDLSLFLRDGHGRPTLAGTDRLPAFPEVEPIDLKTFEAALRAAFENRPEPRRLRLQREKAAVELRLAENQALPSLNAVAGAAQDVGPGKSSLSGPNGLDRTTLNAGVAFQLPVQRRDARGRVMVAQAQLAQIDQQLRQAEDVVRADVQDAFSALERAFEFYQQARKRVALARLVARAEREQLRLGRSDVLRVTLREQAAFDAEVVEIGAQQDYFRALADYRAALGTGGK